MGRVHEYVANHLSWDGRGRLLDVGCGAGALTIRCAKKFPEACCVGIDYWGIKWDYSQRMCQHNAGQYVVMPMMIIVGIVLAWYSIKYVRED